MERIHNSIFNHHFRIYFVTTLSFLIWENIQRPIILSVKYERKCFMQILVYNYMDSRLFNAKPINNHLHNWLQTLATNDTVLINSGS